MGGQLAQRVALRHRQRVRGITSSASLPSDASGLAAARYVHLGLVARIERDLASGVRDTAAQSRQVGAKWHGGRLSELRVPALVLHGERDPAAAPGRRQADRRRDRRRPAGAAARRGHDLPAAVWPRVAGEVRALADRAAVRAAG